MPVDSSCIEADVPLADEAPNMDACLGWDFKPSNVKWLDPDVSSEVAEFPQGTRLTEKNKIYAFHRVTGCPSQFPFFRQRTGFLINLTDVKGMNSDRETTVDQRIRDQIIFFSFSVNTRSLTYVLALALLNDDRTVGAQAHASLVAPRDHSVPINSAYQTSHSSDGTPWRP
jgi:hypothetical protein